MTWNVKFTRLCEALLYFVKLSGSVIFKDKPYPDG